MDDKTKLYVFEKKEVFLIFIFMLLISVISFLLGLKLGQEHGEAEAGITPGDRAKVEKLLSRTEEQVDDIVKAQGTEKKKDLDAEVQQALKKEFEKEFSDRDRKFNETKGTKEVEDNSDIVDADVKPTPMPVTKKEDGLSGKYTIQLGAYRSLDDAEQFANGFKVRGYKPIINEVDLPKKGVWFRVSLGVYDTISDAKEFILKERALIQGYDYRIAQFD
jgi:cell division protein FtsN